MIAEPPKPSYRGMRTPRQGDRKTTKRDRQHMSEGQDTRGSPGEGEDSVAKLRNIHGPLGVSERTMLETVLDSVRGGEAGAYRLRRGSGEDQPQAWQDLVGWPEKQGDEHTRGFARVR